MGIDRKPKGITARLRARKARKDALTAKDVRAEVSERDGYCRYYQDLYLAGHGERAACSGVSEWAHFGDAKRFKTRGQPPTDRHQTRRSLMLCTQHHNDYDAQRLLIEALSEKGCDGPLQYAYERTGWVWL